MPAWHARNESLTSIVKGRKKNLWMVLSIVWKVLYLTTSKTVPQGPIDDAPSSVKGGSTPLRVIIWHGGMGVRIGTSQLLEDLSRGTSLNGWMVRQKLFQQYSRFFLCHCTDYNIVYPSIDKSVLPPYLLVWSGWEHPLLMSVSREVEGIGDHQLPSVEAGRLHEGQWPDPFHHSIGLWCHL